MTAAALAALPVAGPLLVDYDGAATLLGLDSPNWLQENIRSLPHVRLGRYVRFSMANLAEIIALRTVLPEASTAASAVPASLLDLKPGRAPRPRRKPANAASA